AIVAIFHDYTAPVQARHARREAVTASRQAATGLQATHQRLRLIMDVVHDHAILTLDHEGMIVSWNATAERVTGFRAVDVIRKPFTMLHPVTDGELASLFSQLDERGRYEEEVGIVRRDCTLFRAQMTMASLYDPAGAVIGYAVILRDLTETLHAEEKLRRSEEQLRHSQKMDAVGRLASGIAHDFNNVLTAIHGHVQFLLDDLPENAPSRKDAVEIRVAAELATRLTRQLLTFARRQPNVPQVLDLNTVVGAMETLLRRLIPSDITLEAELQEVPQIVADPGQLEQIVVNLVVNAREALPPGGTINLRTSRVWLEEFYTPPGSDLAPGEYVQLSVSDDGPGMSADVQRQVFEPFFTTKSEGTGLGLSTVYGIVKQAGGHITVYSEEGIGTTFKMYLPAYHGATQDATASRSNGFEQRAPAGATASEADAGCVLLVEDDTAVRALARRTLQSGGFSVVEAASGDEALRLAGESGQRIDVVVTDLMMPKMSGEELAERILEVRPDVGVVVMSGFARASLVREGRLRALPHFLEKPFTPDVLLQTVRDALPHA
ncbi:MAG: ATP-binding protein, partial [Gemmatimonadota bacterium]